MPSNQVSTSTSSDKQASQHARTTSTSTQDQHASAHASAGLNLSILGALSGAFSSTRRNVTRTNADGSGVREEERYDQGAASALARGQGSAYASAGAEEGSVRAKGSEMEQGQGKKVEGKRVDHLGIEA